MTTTIVNYQFHIAAAELCLSQARHFERVGDLTNAEDAHADVAYHLAQAQLCVNRLATARAGTSPTVAA